MTRKVGIYKNPRSRGRPWVVRWFGEYDPTKDKQRHYSKSFARKRDAESFCAAKQTELDHGGTRDKPQDITVGEFVERFLESRVRTRRPATRYNYRLTLGQLAEFVGQHTPLRMVTPEVADSFIATRRRTAKSGDGYSPWSRNRQLGNVKTAFKAAVRWSYLSANPFVDISPHKAAPRRWHHLRPDELRSILDVVPDTRWRAFYLLAYTSGARFGELFNLAWSDFDFSRGSVTIRSRPGSKATPPFEVKDHEARALLLPKQTLEALLAWQAEAPEGVPYVLLTADRWRSVEEKWRRIRATEWQNRFMVNNVVRDMRVHVRRAGLQLTVPLTVHTLRKSFGQNHANAGTPMHVLQGLMGHREITTTREFYLQAADANEREAAARYESLMSAGGNETCVGIAFYRDSQPSDDSPISLNDCPTTT